MCEESCSTGQLEMTINGVLFEDDILQNIFAFLDGESLIKANCCCKNWSTFLKKPSVRVALSSKFQELPLHIDPVNGDDNSTSGSCVWPFKTIERAEQWMENFQGTRKKPKCSGLFRPFLLPSAFDFKEVRFHCKHNNAKCEILPCSVGGRLVCGGKVCSEHGIGWGRWIRDSVKGHFYICFDSDAFVCQMLECKRAACERHFSTLFRQCDVCTRSSKYAKICNAHSKQCLRYVNDDRQGLGKSDYRDDADEWDGKREICGSMCCPVCAFPFPLTSSSTPHSTSSIFSCYFHHNCGSHFVFSENFDAMDHPSEEMQFIENDAPPNP